MTTTQQTAGQKLFSLTYDRARKLIGQLDFEPGRAVPLGPYALTLEHDPDCNCPWGEDDGLCPLVTFGLGGGLTEYPQGSDPADPLAGVSPGWVSRHWRDIARALNLTPAKFDSEAKSESLFNGTRMGETRRDLFRDYLSDMANLSTGYRAWGAACDYLEALADLWKLRGVRAETFERNGYSQGDSVRLLLVATPDWMNRMGMDSITDSDLDGQADTFGAWAFGDCYGFQLCEKESGEFLDSCYGFVGLLWDRDSPVLEAMAESLAEEELNRRRARLDLTRRHVKNRVPLETRAREKAAAPALFLTTGARV